MAAAQTAAAAAASKKAIGPLKKRPSASLGWGAELPPPRTPRLLGAGGAAFGHPW